MKIIYKDFFIFFNQWELFKPSRVYGFKKNYSLQAPHHNGALAHLNKALSKKKPDSNAAVGIIITILSVALVIIGQ